jgi:anthranilate synthase/aminodeoxychorismate synthase-like glutamine amidotransferase
VPRVVVLDNFDSFTYNVAHLLVEAGAEVTVCRADVATPSSLEALRPDLLVISPGPGHPRDALVSMAAVRAFAGKVPVFGVCLGMQVLALVFGGEEPVHGKVSAIRHTGRGVFDGIESPLQVGRYHSLVVTRVPESLEVEAASEDGVPMALRHRKLPLAGVQFHPDSFLTSQGLALMRNVLHGHF